MPGPAGQATEGGTGTSQPMWAFVNIVGPELLLENR